MVIRFWCFLFHSNFVYTWSHILPTLPRQLIIRGVFGATLRVLFPMKREVWCNRVKWRWSCRPKLATTRISFRPRSMLWIAVPCFGARRKRSLLIGTSFLVSLLVEFFFFSIYYWSLVYSNTAFSFYQPNLTTSSKIILDYLSVIILFRESFASYSVFWTRFSQVPVPVNHPCWSFTCEYGFAGCMCPLVTMAEHPR